MNDEQNKDCNCWIGILHSLERYHGNDDLYIDRYVDTLNESSLQSIRESNFFPGVCIARSPGDYIDKRKMLSELFNYCPDCGVKIDWRKLRKRLEKK